MRCRGTTRRKGTGANEPPREPRQVRNPGRQVLEHGAARPRNAVSRSSRSGQIGDGGLHVLVDQVLAQTDEARGALVGDQCGVRVDQLVVVLSAEGGLFHVLLSTEQGGAGWPTRAAVY